MWKNVRDKVFALGFYLHQLFDGDGIDFLFKGYLINDELFERRLIPVASLQGKAI